MKRTRGTERARESLAEQPGQVVKPPQASVSSAWNWDDNATYLLELPWGLKTQGTLITLPGTEAAPFFVVAVQSLSRVRLFVTPWTAACQISLSITISQSLLKLMSIKSVMLPNHLILGHLLLLLPSSCPSIRIFSKESALLIRQPNYWSFSFNISPSNGYSGLVFFRIDWFDLIAVQGTLKGLIQHHSSKASIHQCLLYVNPKGNRP